MEQQNENKSGDDQKNENKNENQSGKDQQNKNEEVFYNLDGVGKNEPTFNIIKNGEDNDEVKANSRIKLAISLSKFRTNYLFHFDKIDLQGDIYQKDYFQFFLEIACEEDDKFVNDERFLPYSPYLYVYSDIWGFDELKQKIDELWQNHPGFFEKNYNKEKDKNESFINNLISYIDQSNSNSKKSDGSFTNITPAEYFEANINTILKEAEENDFIHVSPRIFNIILQSIHKEKLDGKIYFDFLMKYITEASKNKKDLLFYEPLISYIDFDVLTYENIEKFVNLHFSKTKSNHINSEVSTSNIEKNKDEKEDKNKDEKEDKNKDEKKDKNKDEKEDKNKDEKKDKNKDEKGKREAAEATEEEEEEGEEEEEEIKEEEEFKEEGEYFDFLTFTQFRSFAQKLVDENKRYRKEIEELKKGIEVLDAKYDENKKNLSECFVDQQVVLNETTKKSAKEIKKKIESNQKSIEELADNNKDLDKILEQVKKSSTECNEISKKLENIKSSVESMEYKYNISSYIISAINRQFIPINRSEKSIMKIDKYIDGIKCIADLNNQNDNANISFDFTSIKGKDNNPLIYFYPNSNVKAQPNQNENKNKNDNDNDSENENDIFIDFMIREYEIEVEDSDFQKLISWEIEGFFPKDFDSYKKYKNYEKISDDQWFPISIHSAADAIIYDDKYKSNQQFDTLFTDNKYKIYKCRMGFSPICKCIRFKMIRNSSDTNIMKISRFQISGQVLQPFKPQTKS